MIRAVGGITKEAAEYLALNFGEHDLLECNATGHLPYQSLVWGAEGGWSQTVFDGELPIGAYGWTRFERTIWSYWVADLSSEQSRVIRINTVPVIRSMVAAAGKGMPLHNVVHEDNRRALAWLRASHCFNIEVDKRLVVGDQRFVPFYAKPLSELPSV